MVVFSRQNQDSMPEASHLLEDFSKEINTSLNRVMNVSQSTTTHGFKLPSWTTCYHLWKQFLFFLLPSYIQSRLRPEATKGRLYPTAYLDGLRGLAAFFVFFYHFYYTCHNAFEAYGANDENWEIVKLPVIRIFYNGTSMVSIFFVVSGYALSLKPIKLMRGKRWDELLHSLSSTVFRRAMRLFLPCIASTLMIVAMVRLGAYEPTMGIAYDSSRLTDRMENHVGRWPTLYGQLSEWGQQMWKMTNPFTFSTWGSLIDIDNHLWTIPVEFRSSIILFVTQLGVCRMKFALRLTVLTMLLFWCLFRNRWEMVLFYGGYILAELDLRRSTLPTLPFTSTPASSSRRDRLWSFFYIFAVFGSLYLCSQPNHVSETAPGWQILSALIPSFVEFKERYWPDAGAILLVWAVSNSPLLQRVFTNGPVQYLGRISFSLYVVHSFTIHTIGYKSLELLWAVIGYKTMLGKETGFCIATIILSCFTVWLADLFMRIVDTPSVKFAKWLEERCMVQLEGED